MMNAPVEQDISAATTSMEASITWSTGVVGVGFGCGGTLGVSPLVVNPPGNNGETGQKHIPKT
ncbi:hypothetical protein [Mobiluncus mulieris]|uniref:hypothetical protein n=1 Tax=Mobiluncus mulieris TaxID=2052 RepID=UPI0021E1DC47|nr:hypothetical protein [Mobiluncus mulieris]